MGKRRKRRIYTCFDKILCGLGRMYAGGGAKVTLEKACGMGLPETLFSDISINLLKLPSSQGIVGEKSFVASR